MALKRYNGKASIMMAAVFLIPALLVIFTPFARLQHVLLSFIVYPSMLLIAGSVGGLTSFCLGFALIAFSGIYAAGVEHSMPFTLFLLPLSVVWLVCLKNGFEYQKAVIMVLIAHILSSIMLLGYFKFFKPEVTPYFISRSIIKGIDSMPEKDVFLYALTNTGILSLKSLPEKMQVFNDAAEGIVFMPQVRKELYSQLALRLETLLRTFPTVMLSGESIWTAFCGTTLALHIGRRYNKTENSFQLPYAVPFSMWSLSPAIRKGMAILFFGYIATSFMHGALFVAGQMMYTTLTTLLTIQGLSLTVFWLSRFVKRFYLKLFLLIVIFTILSRGMVWIGLFDLIFNFRMRINPIYPNDGNSNDNSNDKEDII